MNDFIKRLGELMEYYSIPASAFADKINVQRSGISHLLAGRNKPSLDFVLKIIAAFPEVDLYWLLDGSGTMMRKDRNQTPDAIVPSSPMNSPSGESADRSPELKPQNHPPTARAFSGSSKVSKIIVLYEDGTFNSFEPN